MQHAPGVSRFWWPVALVAAGLTAGCGNYYMLVDGHPDAYFVGDTATFVAQEMFESLDDHDGKPRSSDSPELYSWSSAQPAVSDFIAQARAVMISPGVASLQVRTSNVRETIRIFVLPPNSAMRVLTPAVSMHVGDTLTLRASVVDSTGQALSFVRLRRINWSGAPAVLGADGQSYVFTEVGLGDSATYRANSAGSGYAVVQLSTSKGRLADSVRIIVR